MSLAPLAFTSAPCSIRSLIKLVMKLAHFRPLLRKLGEERYMVYVC